MLFLAIEHSLAWPGRFGEPRALYWNISLGRKFVFIIGSQVKRYSRTSLKPYPCFLWYSGYGVRLILTWKKAIPEQAIQY